MQYLCGIDEAGRGSILGPLVVASVVLKEGQTIEGVKDSKKIKSASVRDELFHKINLEAEQVIVKVMDSIRVDVLGIGPAWETAVICAIQECQETYPSAQVIVDGNVCPVHKLIHLPVRAEPKADDKYCAVSAASIVAKWFQVFWMEQFHNEYPEYGAAKHKGYGTSEHVEALKKHGFTRHHRGSYKVKV